MDLILLIWYRIIGGFFRILPIKNNYVLMENFFGKGYGDSPKYIAETLLKSDKVKIFWLVKNKFYDDIPTAITQIRRGSFSELYYLSVSKFWIDNSRKHYGIRKRKAQVYIQTWHGGIAVKKIERDVINTLPRTYIKSAKNDSKMINYLLVNNKKYEFVFNENFWYKGELLEVGTPRTDTFFENFNVDELKEKLNISKNTHIILYTPTFRDNNIDAYNLNYTNTVKLFTRKFGGNWKIFIRLHPNICYLQNSILYTSDVINASNYSDINDLIKVCDYLITDYSSCMFDAMFAKKNVLIYASDELDYEKSRGVYIHLNELPFPISRNNEDFCKIVKDFDQKRYSDNVSNFIKEIGSFEDGNASKEVVDKIYEILNKIGEE